MGTALCPLAGAGDPTATRPFTDHRNPPAYRALADAAQARYELGMAVFNTQFVAAGTPNAGRRDGLGPLFNAASCDACHNNGAHGRGPTEDGPAPASVVIELAVPSTDPIDPPGDPVYGRVLNTSALGDVPPEGAVMIHYDEQAGHYPDGNAWHRRAPRYDLTGLQYGPMAATTVVKPRLAPALFGVGLLEAAGGRFGWQGNAVSVRDQTTRAFAREMGLTTRDIAQDDCTPAETKCLQQPNGGAPEVSDELLDAVLTFEQYLAVPSAPAPQRRQDPGEALFTSVGCAACHQKSRRVELDGTATAIEPYTDLALHELGPGLADRDVAGHLVASRWRTAPLWGLGYRISSERFATFLHDGRARSVEEAILWHDGEAAPVRKRFERLSSAQRRALLHWVETL